MTHQQRIEKLRQAAVEPVISYEEFHLLFFGRLHENQSLGSMRRRYADAYRHAFERVSLCLDDGELIVGKAARPLTEEEQGRWATLRDFAKIVVPMYCGQDSHMTVDFELVLSKGLGGVAAEIDERLQTVEDAQQREFYETCRDCLEAAVVYCKRYSELAAQTALTESDAQRRQELERIAAVCARVPEQPAESFYEAVQAVHFTALLLSFDPMRFFAAQQFQLGHPDRYLWPYYEKDLREGRITPEAAQELLDCLTIQINRRVPRGLSSGYMVGGRDRNGSVVANDLTVMCMNVIENVRLVYPSVGLCYTEGMPDSCLQRACEILAQGRSHPAIFNDDVISAGLREYGVPEAECHDYIHSTCVEITPERSSNVWVASPYINLMQPLLDSLKYDHESMEQLLGMYFLRLDYAIKTEFEKQNRLRGVRKTRSMNPLLSCLVNDCLQRGVDIEQGGARYNWIMPSFVGMSNLVDSLTVLQRLVFEQKQYTIAQIKAMLDCDFEGCELQRLQLLNAVPKYGNDEDEADHWCELLTEHIAAECKKHTPMYSNARLVPSVFCWVMHERLGSCTGATPDGRKAGFALGDGSGPAQGRERKGPTASVLSSTKWSHKEFIGGVAVNMKFSKRMFTADSCARMMTLIKTYLRRGGFEMQINVVDRDLLLAAQADPEQYRDLVVRIGGYSDYFVHLSPGMQAEVLLRTEHEV
ncbi:MAG: hypothetical protein IJC25_02955 [Clostridia bacterium]|nr:hypothetical protein [Clostridia bacterium]